MAKENIKNKYIHRLLELTTDFFLKKSSCYVAVIISYYEIRTFAVNKNEAFKKFSQH